MRKFFKNFFEFSLLIILLGTIYYYRENINTFVLTHFYTVNKDVKLTYKNEYFRDYNYKYVKITDDFLAKDKKQLIDIYYTIINSGIENFSFYCSNSYKSCITDVVEIANNQETLSNINSFVHPYNSFNSIETKYDTLGKITLKINKSYTKDQIQKINTVIAKIMKDEIKDEKDEKLIIKKIHDYIINNSKYDKEKSNKQIDKYASSIAYGPLIEGYGLCGGYTDAMTLFLDYYKIPNFKVISENHIWNAVYIDNEWYHLDLTWDDPVTSDGSDVLEYNFFLITTKELEELETNQHVFDKDVFEEVK